MGHVVIVGSGPGGATLGYLLARNGVQVTLLERHGDFSREFRGELLMPSGLEPFFQMGLWDAIDALPHTKLASSQIYFEGVAKVEIDFDSTGFGDFAPRWISQPALLERLVVESAKHGGFQLERGVSVSDLIEEKGRIVGVRAKSGGEAREIRGDLVVGADGRTSVVRRRAGLAKTRDAIPMDIIWTKLPMLEAMRRDLALRAYLGNGHLLIAAPIYGDEIQIAWIIRKGRHSEIRKRGMAVCLEEMARQVSADLREHLLEHRNDGVESFLLSTVSDRVSEWTRPGLLVIGDAAHTMSPVGAQGLNIAIRDAVVAANHLVPVLAAGDDPQAIDRATAAVEAERVPEVSTIQRFQAIPPRIFFRTAWWARAVLRCGLAVASTRFGSARAAPVLTRFAEGQADVRVRV